MGSIFTSEYMHLVYGSVSGWNYLFLELSLYNVSKNLKQKQFCNISKKIIIFVLKINRLKNSSVFSRAMPFFTDFLSFRGLILQVLQHMQVLNVLSQLSCSGALQIHEMQMAIQKNVEVCLHPYFQLIAGPVTFHASYPM